MSITAERRTTLISTLVNPLSEISWRTGSRTVNCALMRVADPGPFAVLRGSVRDGVTIEGEAPVVPTTTEVPSPGDAQQQPGAHDGGAGAAPAPAAPAGDAGGEQPAAQGEVPVAGAEQPAAEIPAAGN